MRQRFFLAAVLAILVAFVSWSAAESLKVLFAQKKVNLSPARSVSLSTDIEERSGAQFEQEFLQVADGTGSLNKQSSGILNEQEPSALHGSKDDDDDNVPRLALIIDDFGYNKAVAAKILKMKLTATWAIIPTAPHSVAIAEMAEKNGQPFILHVPMQALVDKEGSQEYVIGTATLAEKVASLLAGWHKLFPAALGANNHRGSKATSDAATMKRFMKAIAAVGWGFVDSYTSPRSVAKKTAEKYHVPVIRNDVFNDGTTDVKTMQRNFSRALRLAQKRGKAVAICHAREKTLPVLAGLSTLDTGPVKLVTIDAMWERHKVPKEEKR